MSSTQLVPKSNRTQQILYGSNTIANFAGIIGVSVWASSNSNWWGVSSAYGFYWFAVITSFLISGFGLSFYGCTWVHSRVDVLPKFTNIFWVATQALYTIFMLSAGASVAQESSGCTAWDTQYYNFSKLCDGMIVSAVFGFVSFALWASLTVLTSMDIYRDYKNGQTTPVAPQPPPPPQPVADVESPAS